MSGVRGYGRGQVCKILVILHDQFSTFSNAQSSEENILPTKLCLCREASILPLLASSVSPRQNGPSAVSASSDMSVIRVQKSGLHTCSWSHRRQELIQLLVLGGGNWACRLRQDLK